MPRGRPVGTKKRERAQVAAQAVWDGEFVDVRSSAENFRSPDIGEDGFRHFVQQVEEAYRELLKANNVGSLRRYEPLSERTLKRQSQTKPGLKYVRTMLGFDDPI